MRAFESQWGRLFVATFAAAAIAGHPAAGAGQQGATTRTGTPPAITGSGQTNWASHNLDMHNQRFSELDQIDTATVGQLQRRWSYDVAPGLNVGQTTPLVVDGVMYLHAGATVLAVNALTGEEIWKLEIEGVSGGPVRGPLYVNGTLYSYHSDKLVAADAETGELVETFGDGGVLPIFSLALAMKYPDTYPPGFDAASLNYRINSSPAYHDNTLYVGSAISEGNIPGGLVVAADATTGRVKWVFNTIPQRPQDQGWEIAESTWGEGKRVGAGVWTQPAIDIELGLLYFNTANPNPPYDGSARPGANLFTNSTVALDLETGELRWFFQTIHHDLWDWDNVTGPVLFDVTRNGELIKGIAASGKNCLLYMWRRDTGAPINPMVETPVPTETNVPGEVVYPTQPIPHNARGVPLTPFCATYLDLGDPELQAQARQMYTPYSTDEHYIVAHGGSSFGSPSFSPRTGPALRHRQERRRVAARQAARRQPGAGTRRGPSTELHRDQPHPVLPTDDDADRLRAGQRGGRLAAGAAGAHLRRVERQRLHRRRSGVSGHRGRRLLRVPRGHRGAALPLRRGAHDTLEPADLRGERHAVHRGDRVQHGTGVRPALTPTDSPLVPVFVQERP